MDIVCHKGKWIKLPPVLLNSCPALQENQLSLNNKTKNCRSCHCIFIHNRENNWKMWNVLNIWVAY